MRSIGNTLLTTILVVAALGLAVLGLLYRQGQESPPEVAQAVVETASPSPPPDTPPPETAYPAPATPSPPSEGATPYPEPRPTRTPRPTHTLHPAILTRIPLWTAIAAYTPTPTATPPPPTPTATPLPPLDPALETLLYAVQGEAGPELMRVQVDAEGRPAGSPQAFTPSWMRHPRVSILGLVPSPAGRYVSILYVGSATANTALLDTRDWGIDSLIPEPLAVGLYATPQFLDWSPDGQYALLRGAINGLGAGEELWLLDLATREYRVLPSIEGSAPSSGGRTAYAPDGKTVAVATERDLGDRFLGETWIVPLDAGEPHRVAEALGEHGPVQWIGWSPRGDAIALAVQRGTGFTSADIVRCELWLVPLDGDQPRQIGHMSADNRAAPFIEPLWESDGTGIVFVRSEGDEDAETWDQFTGNLYRVDVVSGETVPLTAFDRTPVLAPRRGPGDTLTFATGALEERQQVWRLPLDAEGRAAGEVARIDGVVATGGSRGMAPGVAWIPTETP